MSQLMHCMMHLWHHQQLIVMSSAERKPSKWDTGLICEDHPFWSSFMDLLCHEKKMIYVLSWQTVYVVTRVLFRCLFSEFATQKISTKITLLWTHEQFTTQVRMLFYMCSCLYLIFSRIYLLIITCLAISIFVRSHLAGGYAMLVRTEVVWGTWFRSGCGGKLGVWPICIQSLFCSCSVSAPRLHMFECMWWFVLMPVFCLYLPASTLCMCERTFTGQS